MQRPIGRSFLQFPCEYNVKSSPFLQNWALCAFLKWLVKNLLVNVGAICVLVVALILLSYMFYKK